MKYCPFCNNVMEDEDLFCRNCGKEYVRTVASKGLGKGDDNSITSLFLKYARYLDNNTLFRVAWAKEKGIVSSEFPDEAEEIYKVLAFKGHLDSMYRYACIILSKPNPDLMLAQKWLKAAAVRGHQQSQTLLSVQDWSNIPHGSPDESGHNAAVNMDEVKPIARAEGSLAQRIEKVLPSIVMVNSFMEDKSVNCGSGFILENGLIVTNAHVIGDAVNYVEIRFEPTLDKESYPVMPVAYFKDYDICILAVIGEAGWLSNKNIGLKLNTAPCAYGDEVYTIGNPLGIGLSVSKGVVSAPARQIGYPESVDEVIQTDITINHGNSGGALFDETDSVIGVVTFVPSDSEGGMGMCIPAKYVLDLVNQVK